MTVPQSTGCTLIQGFPVLLILAQNHNYCLTTPFMYKPPSPTHSPEYYEALDALYHTLNGHGYHGFDGPHGYDSHHGFDNHHGYESSYPSTYGNKYPVYGHGHSYPEHGHTQKYPEHGHGQKYPVYGHGTKYPQHSTSYKPVYPYPNAHHGYPGVYYKKCNNNKCTTYDTTTKTYAPNHFHVQNKYKVVVKKNKSRNKGRRHNKKSGKLQEETCDTIEGGIGSCISILQCGPYLRVLQDSRTNPQAVQILRRAHCGFEGNNPKVCCPRPEIPTARPTAPPTTTTTTAAPEPAGKTSPEDFVVSFPEPPVCGVSNASFSRVVGGVDAKLGDFPWMALLGYKSRQGAGARWLCGGSLISSKHVLTAAHCIHGRENDLFVVRLGELDLEKEDEGATPVDVLIKDKIKHEQYSSTAFTNDIGILVLERDVGFTHLIKPICIPKDSELRARSFENYNPIIAGWGDTEFRGPSASRLQALQLPVVSNDFCASAYSAYKAQQIDQRVLCAGYKKGGRDACQGDSGGPLMQPIWNAQEYTTHFYQIGVVSYGKKCAEAGFPGVYTRVTHFVPWLEEKVLGRADV